MTHVAILGGGPAGYVAALRARQLGGEVSLIEMDGLGGACTHRGCIPSKVLLRSAEVARQAQEMADYGVLGQYQGVDWARVMQRKAQVVAQSARGIEYLIRQGGVHLVRGRGRLIEPLAIAVETEGKEEVVRADRVVIATGSVPARPPLPGFDLPGVLTSDELLELDRVPESLAIIGGGAIGVEMAEVFSSVGARVSLIELLPRIVPLEDEEISAELARVFRRRRIELFTSAQVSAIMARDGRLAIQFTQDGKAREVEAELVLCAVGRRPNSEGLGLAEAQVELEGRAVKVNRRMETSAPGVYAAGDVIGGIQLAHVAWAEGKVAAANALGRPVEMDYRAVPSVVFTHPEIGSVGLTEARAREQGLAVKVGRYFFRAAGRALAEGHREGVAKIVADAQTGKVLGGQVIGARATDLVHEVVVAVRLGLTAEELGETIHAHPTLSEPVMEAAEDTMGRSVHK